MTHISLTINGTQRDIDVEPRRSLVDYLRDDERLTGTHVGCEHGVCGACTVLIDGAPARSCITYAVACESAEIITLEGLEDDPVISELRSAFHEHHALQCGAHLLQSREPPGTPLPGRSRRGLQRRRRCGRRGTGPFSRSRSQVRCVRDIYCQV